MRSINTLPFGFILRAALVLLLLAGCGTVSPPAGQTPSPTAARSTEIKIGEHPVFYAVQDGDTIASIADKFKVPVAALLTLNGLGADSDVSPGQWLLIHQDSQETPLSATQQPLDPAEIPALSTATISPNRLTPSSDPPAAPPPSP